jgi:hypothetical protein
MAGRKISRGNPGRRKPPIPMVGSAPVPPLQMPKPKKKMAMGPGALAGMLGGGAGAPPPVGGGLG